jgi:hypothetical protein
MRCDHAMSTPTHSWRKFKPRLRSWAQPVCIKPLDKIQTDFFSRAEVNDYFTSVYVRDILKTSMLSLVGVLSGQCAKPVCLSLQTFSALACSVHFEQPLGFCTDLGMNLYVYSSPVLIRKRVSSPRRGQLVWKASAVASPYQVWHLPSHRVVIVP